MRQRRLWLIACTLPVLVTAGPTQQGSEALEPFSILDLRVQPRDDLQGNFSCVLVNHRNSPQLIDTFPAVSYPKQLVFHRHRPTFWLEGFGHWGVSGEYELRDNKVVLLFGDWFPKKVTFLRRNSDGRETLIEQGRLWAYRLRCDKTIKPSSPVL